MLYTWRMANMADRVPNDCAITVRVPADLLLELDRVAIALSRPGAVLSRADAARAAFELIVERTLRTTATG